MMDLQNTCLVFPFSRTNATAISVLLASLDIHPVLKDLTVFLPSIKDYEQEVEKLVGKYQSIILAVSVYSTQLERIHILLENSRKLLVGKTITTIAGGPHAIGDPLSMIRNGADIVCTGEGENVFSRIIEEIITTYNKEQDLYQQLENIKGIAYLKEGRFTRTGKAEPVNLDDFPPFSVKHKIFRPIEITRGCAWKCRFCQTRNKNIPVKHRSYDQIMKYVRLTVEHFSSRRADIRFISPNALSYGSQDGKSVNLDEIEQLLDGIRSIIGEDGKIYFGSFPSEIRPETVTVESVKLLRKYTNVSKLIIGGQSGSNKVLNIAERGHSCEETERAVKLLIDTGFEVDVDIIFGLPGEEEEDRELTMDHIKRLTNLGATIHSHTFMPLVGTPFANKKPGILSKQYISLVTQLQNEGKLSGQHSRQEKEAKNMADRRKRERMYL